MRNQTTVLPGTGAVARHTDLPGHLPPTASIPQAEPERIRQLVNLGIGHAANLSPGHVASERGQTGPRRGESEARLPLTNH